MSVELSLSNGQKCYVDEHLLDVSLTYTWADGLTKQFVVSQVSWHWNRKRQTLYVHAGVRDGRRVRHVYLHRLVTQSPHGVVVDHIDHNTANNTLANLRFVTTSQNIANADRKSRGACPYVGVGRISSRSGVSFVGRVAKSGVIYQSHRFATEIEAALWRDAKAIELYGPAVFLDFPHGSPSHDRAAFTR